MPRIVGGKFSAMPLRTRVKIPGTGKILSLAVAREAMVRRESWLGQKPETVRAKLLKQISEFERLCLVVDTYNRTGSFKSAGEAGSVSRETAKAWVEGRTLPRNVSLRRAEHYEELRKRLRIVPSKAADFAYVLGVMMNNAQRLRGPGQLKETQIALVVKDGTRARAFAKSLRASMRLKGIKILRFKGSLKGYFGVVVGSRNMIQLFNELTDYGSRLPGFSDPKSPFKKMLLDSGSPVSFLGSKEERRRFVQAIFDGRGLIKPVRGVKARKIEIKPLPALKDFVQKVLRENGMHPWVREKDGYIVLSTTETGLFFRTIGLNRKI